MAEGCSEPLRTDEVLILVDHLFDKSLVVWEPSGYRLLQTVREFAFEQLIESGGEEQARRQHFDYFCAFARETEGRIRGPEQNEWYKKYAAAQDDVRAALDFGFSRDDLVAAASEMTFDLTAFWFNASSFLEAVGFYRQALNACPPGESDLRARLMRRGGMMRHYSGDKTAGESLRAALEMAKRVGSDQTLADAYFSYGLYSNDTREVIENLEEALSRFERVGDDTGMGFCLAGIGEIAYVTGDYAVSRTFFRLSLEKTQAYGDLRSAGASIGALAAIDLAEGKVEQAREGLSRGIAMILETGATFSIYSMFPLIVEYVEHIGKSEDAARLMGWSEKLRRSVGGIRDRMDQFVFDHIDENLRERLGTQGYDTLLAEGAALSNDEAIKLASDLLRSPVA